MKYFIFVLSLTMSVHAMAQDADSSSHTTAYVGTYTQGDSSSRGVYAISLGDSGLEGQPALVAELKNASFVAMHPDRPLIYVVSEVGAGGPRYDRDCRVFHQLRGEINKA